jgi:alginate O-acetyltransferase complex protein AlgI
MSVNLRDTVTPKRQRPLHTQYLPSPLPTQNPRTRHFLDTGLYPGEPEACRRAFRPFLYNLAHLALLLAVFKEYRLEERAFHGRAFQTLVLLALLALPLHYLTAFRWKKPLFIAVSLAGLFFVFGTQVALAVLLVAVPLIGTCLLPLPWLLRAAIAASLAVAICCLRFEFARPLVPDIVWPIVASLFMFRLIIYFYEIKHITKPESLADTLCYFFLLPNYCFLHFPVVDYRTMQRGYFAADVHAIQRRGLQMMFRGTIHLLCYRLVYHELLIPDTKVHDLASLAAFLVCNYLLYLKVSGQFHMACGMLHLFGFQLPETHHRYLLATGFTDYWRRINIYWKDFMIRLCFNPVVFRLKRWPQPLALAIGTVVVFVATWFLHAYQSFWLRGGWGFSVPDALFWGILGGLVLVNQQLELRRGRARDPGRAGARRPATPSVGSLAARALKIAATFTTVTLLWSLWSSPSLAAWVDLIRRGLSGS